MQKEGIALSVADIMKFKTVQGMASACSGVALEIVATQDPVTGTVPLIPVQKWFLEKDIENVHHFNQSFTLKMNEAVDMPRLQSAMNDIVTAHDMLRARYSKDFEQMLLPPDDERVHVPITQSSCPSIDAMVAEINKLQRRLNLFDGPCVVACVFTVKGEEYIFWTVHHFIVDLVSWRILLSDLELAYTGKPLPRKPHRTERGRMRFKKGRRRCPQQHGHGPKNKKRPSTPTCPRGALLIQRSRRDHPW